MKIVESLRLRWQEWTGEEDTPFDGDAGAWAVSVAVHCVAVLALFFLVIMPKNNQVTLTVKADKDPPVEELKQVEEVYFDVDPSEEIGANSTQGAEAALAQAPVFSNESVVPTVVDDIPNPTVNVELNVSLATSPVISNTVLRPGSAVGVGATGASGAVDRLTYEILESLEQKPTLVVWMFDSTLSLKQQRSDIGSRFKKIYEELGILEKGGNAAFKQSTDDKPLLSVIVSYGQGIKLLTEEPTDDVAAMHKAVESIEQDKTGVENTFSTVKAVATKYLNYRTEKRRNVMLIAVTDEVGTDQNLLDDTLTTVRRYQMPVYVVGVPAPFGRQQVPFRYVNDDPKFEETEYWIPVDQGPESCMPEAVKLSFWGHKVNNEETDLLDSGFGPYALTRLAAETGGIYFSVHPNKTAEGRALHKGGRGQTPKNTTLLYHFWDPGVMRPYAPDYLTIDGYQKLVLQNKARYALVGASKMTEMGAMDNPQLRFVKKDEGSLGKEASEAQKKAAVLEPRLRALYDVLKQGEADRAKLTGPRWQAGFDLAMGRVMAHVVRTEGYNQMIAEVKAGKAFKDKKNNTWVMDHSGTITTGSSAQKMADMAKTYLERVVKEHPGTPWAFLAERELATPFGWEWKEEFTEIPKENMGGGGGAAANPADALNKMMRKPQAPRPPL